MLFVDTSALVALADSSDRYHHAAVGYLKSLRIGSGSLIVTGYILDETFTHLRRAIGHRDAVRFGEAVLTSLLYTVVNVDARTFKLAWEWFKTYNDKEFSFTDCTSFVVMKALRLDKAFAFDKHFVQAGFTLCQEEG